MITNLYWWNSKTTRVCGELTLWRRRELMQRGTHRRKRSGDINRESLNFVPEIALEESFKKVMEGEKFGRAEVPMKLETAIDNAYL